ncbi:hypothetical protein BRAS3843_1110013 [Bradyrhizobium sp. STM 3843]|uniref:hypothetical protein n=1 Tax=Bradyrhizobium sp. STM 3843 TaxID=551947 RepID=UPI000240A8C9|nr:hypothetical protein [Bradyrhizobium sp. STM 3843]CCE04725.1 hypothetical protein BRAS3843_1110013 [Bradyrhizobium sp. STM 3843]
MLTDTLLHVLYDLAQSRFLVLFACIFLGLGAQIVPPFRPRADGQARFRTLIPIPLGVVLGVGNLIYGTELSANFIHRYGMQGQATVTGSYDTGNSYNDQRVMGHNVLIRTADAKTVETSFTDADFNVYPPANGVYYPQQGDIFNVSYIASFPQDFIIISNDDSPWARRLAASN